MVGVSHSVRRFWWLCGTGTSLPSNDHSRTCRSHMRGEREDRRGFVRLDVGGRIVFCTSELVSVSGSNDSWLDQVHEHEQAPVRLRELRDIGFGNSRRKLSRCWREMVMPNHDNEHYHNFVTMQHRRGIMFAPQPRTLYLPAEREHRSTGVLGVTDVSQEFAKA